MKIRMTPVTKYLLHTVDGKELGEFDRQSEWEGMARLAGKQGVVIVESPDVLRTIFGDEDGSMLVDVVKASPRIIEEIATKVPLDN